MASISTRLSKSNFFQILISYQFHLIIIFVGIVLRLKHFLENRPFWLDEAYTAISITSRSIGEILSYNLIFHDQPQTPLFFTLIEKIFVITFGNNEYILRLFPLLAGVLSLFLFYRLLRLYVPSGGISIALSLFSLSGYLVYYSAELKPYSSDVLIVLIIYPLMEHLRSQETDMRNIRTAGILGALFLWCSYAAIFLLSGIAMAYIVAHVKNRKWEKFRKYLIIYLYWLSSFILLYKVSLSRMLESPFALNLVSMPVNNGILESALWFKGSILGALKNPIGISFPLLAAVVFIMGCIRQYKKDKMRFFLLINPVLLVWLAGMAHTYPLEGRMLLFTVPAFLIFLSQGALVLLEKHNRVLVMAGVLIIGSLLWEPIRISGYYLVHARNIEGGRTAVEYLNEHYSYGDLLILNTSAQYPFWYYSGQLHFVDSLKKGYIKDLRGEYFSNRNVAKIFDQLGDFQGIEYAGLSYENHIYDLNGCFRTSLYDDDPNKIEFLHKNMSPGFFQSKKGWVFLSHIKPEVKDFILSCLDRQGRRLKDFNAGEASVIYYEFNSGI